MQCICSKTGDEGSIYAARQGMRACNILRMLLLLHALIPCLAAYILPSSPVLLHIYCPHPLSCCIYTALIPSCCIYTALVSLLFGTVIPTSFNILMEMFLLSLYHTLPVSQPYLCSNPYITFTCHFIFAIVTFLPAQDHNTIHSQIYT